MNPLWFFVCLLAGLLSTAMILTTLFFMWIESKDKD